MRWINVTVAVAMLVHVVCVPCFAQDVSREAEDAVGEHVKAGVSEPIPMGVGTTVLKGILIGAAAGAVVGFAIGPYESEAS